MREKTKRRLLAAVAAGALCVLTAGCAAQSDTISVISREEGSGTRGAFIELMGIEQKNDDGTKTDRTVATADQTNSTGVMLQSVAQNAAAIGYVSLGSLNDTVKAVSIDGAAATVENVKNGTYPVSRPFNIVLGANAGAAANDFVEFILSAEGQSVVEENGYVAVAGAESYAGSGSTGKLTVAGSSSVSPVMEKLIEAYKVVCPGADIELQTSDSTTGVNSVIEGVCDIGMASRELKESESASGVSATAIALDGVAVIVNNDNPVSALTKQQVMEIYTGAVTSWSALG